MLKIEDKTSKQNLSIQDCKIWDEIVIKGIMTSSILYFGKILILDRHVEAYNILTKCDKSNASFVRKIKEMNKQGCFDGLVEKVKE